MKVAVIGAHGRMGAQAVEAVKDADGLDLVAALGSSDSLETLTDLDVDVAVELTVPKATEDNVRFLVEHDIDTVVGTTGWDADRLDRLRDLLADHPDTAVL
ncbi:4-hydroxy-tetrahydrodipicolinate reductase, partial [Geobacillus sp. MMMUD3]|nr:4-hydroxy-tetrahydrodipicolinate reductase [Geobacillus sp. MMMUD3]